MLPRVVPSTPRGFMPKFAVSQEDRLRTFFLLPSIEQRRAFVGLRGWVQISINPNMIDNIFETDTDVQIVIKASHLKELASQLIEKVRDEFTTEEERANQNTYLTTEAVCKMLGKTRSTLWRWEKAGYLVPVKVGKTLKYRLSDVLKIKEGKS